MKPGDSPTTEELREALLKAVEIARAGEEEKPPIDPPARLRQILAFKKFSARAMEQVRAVVETDEGFRERVVAGVDEEAMGRIGWLWLTRPEGWEKEYAELATAAERETEQAADAQSIEALEQRLQRAEAVLEKAERQRKRADADRDAAKAEAAQARAGRSKALDDAEALTADLGETRREREAAQKSLDRALRTQDRTAAKLKSAQTQLDRLKKELRDSREQHGKEVGILKARLEAAEEEAAMARAAGFEPLPASEPDPEPPPPLLKREPVRMPGGLLNDTPGAAEYLLRQVTDIVVLVDGYNVTFKNWEKLPVQQQRHRFLQKMEELSARYSGAEFVVVFDGTQPDYDYISTTARSLGVTERFSPPGVTADDYIISQCDSYPLSRQIVVVSEDGEVREQARDRGANLVHPRKLLEIMGLEVEDPDGWTSFGDR